MKSGEKFVKGDLDNIYNLLKLMLVLNIALIQDWSVTKDL